MQQFTIRIPNKLTISSNRTAEVWKRKKLKDYVTPAVAMLAQRLEPMGKATIYVGVTKRTRGIYDPVNLSDTCKPAVDVLVSSGVLDQDDYHHVLGPWLYHKSVNKNLVATTEFTFILTEYSDLPF